MTLSLQVVDAFTDRPFTGNPAAVAVVDQFPDDERMQSVAREMNLSETAFVVERPDGDYELRWFTPSVEVDLCGHATLATAHVLGGSARFRTRSGVLSCSRGVGGLIEMDFPSDPLSAAELPEGLGIADGVWYGSGKFFHLVEVGDARSVREFEPDLPAIAALGSGGLIVTAAGDREGIDCVSRVFAPNAGIPEDPVTGSAHCTLAGHWAARTGKTELVGEQASARGGIVHMRVAGDRVVLGGHAVTISEVKLLV